jgi:hypothetical protein
MLAGFPEGRGKESRSPRRPYAEVSLPAWNNSTRGLGAGSAMSFVTGYAHCPIVSMRNPAYVLRVSEMSWHVANFLISDWILHRGSALPVRPEHARPF